MSSKLQWILVLCLLLSSFAIAQTPPKREFRGVWLTTVGNGDWPSAPGLSVQTQKDQLLSFLDKLHALGINVVFLQVRPECDALYASPYEPWSYWLTGSQGMGPSPFYDPLQFAVEEAHKRGMELHAWFNPYRAIRSGSDYPKAANHVSNTHPEWMMTIGTNAILDPGKSVIRTYVLNVISDVVRRYDIDGVVMDDYFYVEGITTQDAATFSNESRGFTDLGDWRRDNVNLLIHGIYDSVNAIKPWVKFGMSPRGIWKNGVPPGIIGANNYSDIYCDAVAWLQGKYIDYFSPQLYWKFGGSQDYALLEPWWASQLNGRIYCPSLAAYRIGQTNYGGAGEVAHQIRFYRDNGNAQGNVPFTANNLTNNTGGVGDTLKNDLYRYPALVPVIPWKDTLRPNPPRGIQYARVSGGGSAAILWDRPLHAADGDSASRYVVYRFNHVPALPGELADPKNILAVLDQRQYAPPTPPQSGPYAYVVTALDRNSNESDPSTVLQLDVPAVPVLASPANGATAIPESVLAVWRSPTPASFFHLQVSTDSTFATALIVNDSTITDTMKIIRGYSGQSRAYWRVRAKNGAGTSAFASIFSFVCGTPVTATLLSPPYVSLDQPVMLSLRWGTALTATSYRVQLATNTLFTPAVLDTSWIPDTTVAAPPLQYYAMYFWRVKARNAIGEADWSTIYRFRTAQVSAVDRSGEFPTAYSLSQNYPNPFNPLTTIEFRVPGSSWVNLTVYDMLGREVAVLVDGKREAGVHEVTFDGSGLASGVYFYRLKAGDFVATKRLLLLK